MTAPASRSAAPVPAGCGSYPARGLAVLVPAAGRAPQLVERPVVDPAPDEAVVAVEACGICGSDRLLLRGGFGDVFPVVPGHEAAGTVVAVGSTAHRGWLGRRVALYYLDAPPGGALPGRPNLGAGIRRMGVDTDGAMAQFVTRPVSTLIPADGLAAVEVAVLTDALATPLHAVRLAGVRTGQTVAVIGIGGIGSGAVQFARSRGARVLAVGRVEATRDLALRMGASAYSTSDQPIERLQAAAGAAVDVVVQCVGDPLMDRLAFELIGIGGTVVLVGASTEPFAVSSTELIWKGLTVMGSRGFTPDDVREVIELHRAGHLLVDHLTGAVIDLEQAAASLLRGGEQGVLRTVVRISPPLTTGTGSEK